MEINHERRGSGPPLLLVHGLGGLWQQWARVLDGLARHRDVIAIDLPGFGETPPLPGEVSVDALADVVAGFLDEQGLADVDVVGSSMGGQIALELARRRLTGDVVALDPAGFWSDRGRRVFHLSVRASYPLVRGLRPVLPALAGNAAGRTALFGQLSARPWALPAGVARDAARGFAVARSFREALDALAHGPLQKGAPAGTTPGRVTIGWGRQDRLVLPSQAANALAAFPGAQMHWFETCGHLPIWDQPHETIDLILARTGPS